MKALHTQLRFPANIYAHCQLLDQARTDAWYLGADTSQIWLDMLPASGAILLLGNGLLDCLHQLGGRDDELCALSQDPYQLLLAETLFQDKTGYSLTNFYENFPPAAARYSALLCIDGLAAQDSLELLNQANAHLQPDGELLLLDDFSLCREPGDPLGIPLLNQFLAQAERAGFALLETQDLSAHVLTQLNEREEQLIRHHERLLTDLPVLDSQIKQLRAALQHQRQDYHNAKRACRLLRLRKQRRPRWRVSVAQPSNQAAIRDLFQRVFGHPMSPELWQWKYGDGRGIATLAWRDEKLIAHYGGLLRPLHYFGVPQGGVQIGDVMVDADERGVLTRKGAFYLAAATFPERWVGYGAPVLVGYGFPTAQAMRVAERQGLYAEVGHMLELHWPAQAGRPRLRTKLRPLQSNAPSAAAVLNRLWELMAADLREYVLGVRNWDYVRHRYLHHPHKHYELLLVKQRFGGLPLGLAVVEKRAATCHLLDYIGPLRHLPLTLRQVRRQAASWGYQDVSAWVSDANADFFRDADCTEIALDVRIPTSIQTPGPTPETLRGRWWLTGGDTDFN